MKFSSNILMIILIFSSTLFLYNCSHNSCPAYANQNDIHLKKDINEEVEKTDINRDV